MTRRGSIAYYLAVVVCGSFFLAAAYFAYLLAKGDPTSHPGRDFLFFYFFVVLAGVVPHLVGAWILRRVASRLRWSRGWQWMTAGTAIGMALLWIMGQLALAAQGSLRSPIEQWTPLKLAFMAATIGPMYFLTEPLWIPVPAIAMTSLLLYRVDRAFAERP